MFCRNCQTIIPDDSLFCENCGAPTGYHPDGPEITESVATDDVAVLDAVPESVGYSGELEEVEVIEEPVFEEPSPIEKPEEPEVIEEPETAEEPTGGFNWHLFEEEPGTARPEEAEAAEEPEHEAEPEKEPEPPEEPEHEEEPAEPELTEEPEPIEEPAPVYESEAAEEPEPVVEPEPETIEEPEPELEPEEPEAAEEPEHEAEPEEPEPVEEPEQGEESAEPELTEEPEPIQEAEPEEEPEPFEEPEHEIEEEEIEEEPEPVGETGPDEPTGEFNWHLFEEEPKAVKQEEPTGEFDWHLSDEEVKEPAEPDEPTGEFDWHLSDEESETAEPEEPTGEFVWTLPEHDYDGEEESSSSAPVDPIWWEPSEDSVEPEGYVKTHGSESAVGQDLKDIAEETAEKVKPYLSKAKSWLGGLGKSVRAGTEHAVDAAKEKLHDLQEPAEAPAEPDESDFEQETTDLRMEEAGEAIGQEQTEEQTEPEMEAGQAEPKIDEPEAETEQAEPETDEPEHEFEAEPETAENDLNEYIGKAKNWLKGLGEKVHTGTGWAVDAAKEKLHEMQEQAEEPAEPEAEESIGQEPAEFEAVASEMTEEGGFEPEPEIEPEPDDVKTEPEAAEAEIESETEPEFETGAEIESEPGPEEEPAEEDEPLIIERYEFPKQQEEPEPDESGLNEYLDKAKVLLGGLGKTLRTGTEKAADTAKEKIHQLQEKREKLKEEAENAEPEFEPEVSPAIEPEVESDERATEPDEEAGGPTAEADEQIAEPEENAAGEYIDKAMALLGGLGQHVKAGTEQAVGAAKERINEIREEREEKKESILPAEENVIQQAGFWYSNKESRPVPQEVLDRVREQAEAEAAARQAAVDFAESAPEQEIPEGADAVEPVIAEEAEEAEAKAPEYITEEASEPIESETVETDAAEQEETPESETQDNFFVQTVYEEPPEESDDVNDPYRIVYNIEKKRNPWILRCIVIALVIAVLSVGGVIGSKAYHKHQEDMLYANSMIEAEEMVKYRQYDEAEKLYLDMMQLRPEWTEAYLGLAEMYVSQQRYVDATALIEGGEKATGDKKAFKQISDEIKLLTATDWKKAYIKVLEENEDGIRRYEETVQAPVAYCDVNGDMKPELFFFTREYYGYGKLHIYTMVDGKAKEVTYECKNRGTQYSDAFYDVSSEDSSYAVFNCKGNGKFAIYANIIHGNDSWDSTNEYKLSTDGTCKRTKLIEGSIATSYVDMQDMSQYLQNEEGITYDKYIEEFKKVLGSVQQTILYNGTEGDQSVWTHINADNVMCMSYDLMMVDLKAK